VSISHGTPVTADQTTGNAGDLHDADSPAKKRQALLWLAAGIALSLALGLLLALAPIHDGWLLLASAVVLCVTLVRPFAGLCLLPFAVAFGTLFLFTFHGLNVALSDVLIASLAVSVLWRLWRRDGLAPLSRMRLSDARSWLAALWQRDRVRVLAVAAVLAYLAVVLLSVLVAQNKQLAIKEVIKWAEVALLLALALAVIRTVRDVHFLVWAMIGAGVAQALLGFWQWVQVTGTHTASADSLRVFGTFGQPNPYSGYLNFSLPLALVLIFLSKDVRERWLAAASAILIAGAEVLADSRGGDLGLAAAAIVLIVVGLRRERLVGLALLILIPLGAIAWFAHLIPAHIRNSLIAQVSIGPVTNANFSVQERLAHWVAGLRMFRAHPLLGVGAGNYGAAYPQYQLPDWMEALGQAHNYYINAAAETGILGLLAILALVGIALFVGWRATRMQANQWKAGAQYGARLGWALALGLLAVLVAQSVHNLTDDLFVHGMELQFALCLACLLVLGRRDTTSTSA
jgi:O-antigen ligase